MTYRANRDAWIRLIEEMEPNMAITLGMGLPAHPQVLNRAATELCCRIERAALGAGWAAKPASARLRAIGFHEHPNSNRHIHIAAAASPRHADRLMTDGSRLWRTVRSSGDWYCKPITNVSAYARYMTKDVAIADDLDDMFIYVPRDWRNR